jgi:hypothetical protein
MYPPELESKIAELRAKAAEGTLTIEDCKEINKALRADRMSAVAAPKEKKPSTRKKKGPETAAPLEDLTKQLEGN